jgi:hypothetical protein
MGGKVAPGINDNSSKFAVCVNYTSGNFPPVLLVPLTPIDDTSGKFATGVANNGNCIRLYQTVSDLKVNLKKKTYLCVDSTTQSCKKIFKTFLIEDFFHLPLVVHLELRISPLMFANICNGLSMILRGLWETDS